MSVWNPREGKTYPHLAGHKQEQIQLTLYLPNHSAEAVYELGTLAPVRQDFPRLNNISVIK